MNVARFIVGNNWLPQKLNAMIKMPPEYDFKCLLYNNQLLEGEVLLKEEESN